VVLGPHPDFREHLRGPIQFRAVGFRRKPGLGTRIRARRVIPGRHSFVGSAASLSTEKTHQGSSESTFGPVDSQIQVVHRINRCARRDRFWHHACANCDELPDEQHFAGRRRSEAPYDQLSRSGSKDGTESGTEFVVKQCKTTHNVESAATIGLKWKQHVRCCQFQQRGDLQRLRPVSFPATPSTACFLRRACIR
jgi:hypothetical protein